jgi:uncharacterized protein (DUF924 family)
MSPDEVLDFWLGAPDPSGDADAERIRRWFRGAPALDAEIRERFGAARDQALAGQLDDWAATPRGRRALIILLDQFTRNLYRNTPRAYEADPKALALALHGLDAGEAAGLGFYETLFLALPLGHAEDVALQRRNLATLEHKAAESPGGPERYRAAVEHARGYLDQITRFGRFPHRNAILGRQSTAEEQSFLASSSTTG